jgi:hypothetical protein
MRSTESYRSFVPQSKISTFLLTVHVWLLKEDYHV